MNVKEIAQYLGISESIVRRLVKDRQIPHLRIKGCIRFYVPKVEEWLKLLTIETNGIDTERQENEEAERIAEEVMRKI